MPSTIYKSIKLKTTKTIHNRIRTSFKLAAIASLLLIAFPNPKAHAAAAPGDACTTTNAIARDGGVDTSGTNYIMRCNGSTWERIIEMDSAGNMGVGQAAPSAKLHIDGEIILGNTSLGCSAATEGAVRYNTTLDLLELCDGSDWSVITSSTCADAIPDSFNFTDLPNQSQSTLITSSIEQISGIVCQINVETSGDGSPEIRVCANASCSSVLIDWTDLATINNGEYIQARLTTNGTSESLSTAIIMAGGTADAWNVTTAGGCTGTPSYGSVCADGTIYAGLTPDGNVPMYVTRCDAGLTWDGVACSGSVTKLPWNDGSSNWLAVGVTDSLTGDDNTAELATLDSSSEDGTQPHRAADFCDTLTLHGYSDWYLPAVEELAKMYDNIANIANFETSGAGLYHSSTEQNNYYNKVVRFSDGSRPLRSKENSYFIRCARK